MNKFGKRSLALLLCAGLGASMLTGCGKKAEAASIFTYNGQEVDNKVAVLLFRLQEATFDEVYGNMFAQYYGGQSVWDMDLTGQGELYGDTFKEQFKTTLENLLIAQDHAADYDIKLTDDEEKKIAEAADQFIADNDKATLDAMSADKDTVVKLLEMQTIQKKVENEVSATADTEVTDEEAAQRTISYICFTPTTETEAESEEISEAGTEADTDASAAEAETEGSEVTPQAAESETSAAAESETAAAEAEDTDKTGSADTEASQTEAAETEVSQTESETETESPEMQAARAKFKAMADAKFAEIKDSTKAFSEFADEVSDNNEPGISASTVSFGEGDTYPAEEIQDATADLEDDTLVDHVVEANDNYYILHVDKKFDQEKTDEKKEEIIHERQHEAIDDQYTEWQKDASLETDDEAYAELKFDRKYSAPETSAPETEVSAQTEADEAAAETASTEE